MYNLSTFILPIPKTINVGHIKTSGATPVAKTFKVYKVCGVDNTRKMVPYFPKKWGRGGWQNCAKVKKSGGSKSFNDKNLSKCCEISVLQDIMEAKNI